MALIIIIIICIYILVNAKNLGNRNRFDHNPTRIDLTSLDNENIELKNKNKEVRKVNYIKKG